MSRGIIFEKKYKNNVIWAVREGKKIDFFYNTKDRLKNCQEPLEIIFGLTFKDLKKIIKREKR